MKKFLIPSSRFEKGWVLYSLASKKYFPSLANSFPDNKIPKQKKMNQPNKEIYKKLKSIERTYGMLLLTMPQFK